MPLQKVLKQTRIKQYAKQRQPINCSISIIGEQLKQEKGDIEAHNKETLPKWRRMLRVNSGKTEDSWNSTYAFNEEDERTRIMGCATMWHESSEEMIEMIKSIFRIDEDYSARWLCLLRNKKCLFSLFNC